MKKPKVAVVVVAAGRGERARRSGEPNQGPKQYRRIANRAIIAETLATFQAHPAVDMILPVIHADDFSLYAEATAGIKDQKVLAPASGGQTRQASVLAGLRALASLSSGSLPDHVLVHDAVRPFVSPATIDRVVAALSTHAAVLPALAVVDTLKRGRKNAEGALVIDQTVDRTHLWAAQTPQGFHFQALLDAHEQAIDASFTDDCAVMEAADHAVHIVLGNTENIKITTADDIDEAKRLKEAKIMKETRVGNGFDVHAFEEGNAVILGGVSIPHTKKLKGHSDADVGLHTLTDAIYGALAEGDIGSHFPPSDPQWRGAASDQFLIHACDRVRARGGRIVHLDLTIMCEAPKIGPHRDTIRAEIARICGLPVSRVAVKATTTEKLGFTGREEGIAAMATATLELPFED